MISNSIVDSLIADGHEVLIADNLVTGNVRNIEVAIKSGRATFVYADIGQSADALRAAFADVLGTKKIGRIYHLASPASPDAYGKNPWETLRVNSLGTMSLIEIAEEHGARMLFASTSEIYGDPLVHPQHEGYFGNVDPVGPRACYDEGKRFGEAAMSVAINGSRIDGRIVRFFNCYGPRMATGDGRLVPSLVEAGLANRPLPIQGTGSQTRSMTYVDDAVALMKLVMEKPQASLQPVNIGNDHEQSVREVAEAVADALGIPCRIESVPERPADPQRRKPDLTIARSYGWAPKTEFAQGIRQTIEWFREALLSYV